MKEFFIRFKNAFTIGLWAFKNPQTLYPSHFKMLSDLLVLIFKVAEENKPYMTNIATMHPDEREKEIVSLWAGAGVGAEPKKRIEELLRENSILKTQIASKINQKSE